MLIRPHQADTGNTGFRHRHSMQYRCRGRVNAVAADLFGTAPAQQSSHHCRQLPAGEKLILYRTFPERRSMKHLRNYIDTEIARIFCLIAPLMLSDLSAILDPSCIAPAAEVAISTRTAIPSQSES